MFSADDARPLAVAHDTSLLGVVERQLLLVVQRVGLPDLPELQVLVASDGCEGRAVGRQAGAENPALVRVLDHSSALQARVRPDADLVVAVAVGGDNLLAYAVRVAPVDAADLRVGLHGVDARPQTGVPEVDPFARLPATARKQVQLVRTPRQGLDGCVVRRFGVYGHALAAVPHID